MRAPLAITFRGTPGTVRPALAGASGGLQFERDEILAPPAAPQSRLLTQYRVALERESRRMADRRPEVFWSEAVDEDGYPLRGSDRVQRDARKLFTGAGNRVASGWLEDLLESSSGARAARTALQGLRLDVKRGGGVGMGAGPAREASQDVAASVSMVLLGTPRFELRSTLPGGVRARLELPVTLDGVRATVSRKFGGVRGTLSAGSEDDDIWFSAGIEVGF